LKIIIRSVGLEYHPTFEEGAFVIECFDLPDPAQKKEVGISMSGLDQPVQDYLDLHSSSFLARVKAKVKEKIKEWRSPGSLKYEGIIYFCCAGGLHRSVYTAEKIGKWLDDLDYWVEIQHLDIGRYKQNKLT